MTQQTVLVKVGGSLLDLPDLRERLDALVCSLGLRAVAFLAGGGEATDVVRNWDRIHSLSETASHELAIASMSLTAELLARLLPDSTPVADRVSAEQGLDAGHRVILKAEPIVNEIETAIQKRLPIGWDMTSDSIAAWIARYWDFDQLVLAKSVDPPSVAGTLPGTLLPGTLLSDAAMTAVPPAIDRQFLTTAADGPPVFWCNLRERPERLVRFLPATH